MNRSQLVFVIIVNALFTLLAASVAYLIYDLRRPEPEAPFVLEVASTIVGSEIGTPSVQVPAVTPTVALENADATAAEVINSRIYTIREGDTLGAIAELFGVAQSSLAALNGISDPNLIVPGQSLIIPDVRGSTELGTGSALAATDMAVQVLNVGQYAEEAIVIVNLHSQLINLSGWSVVTTEDGAYKFPQMPPLLRGESVRLYSRTGNDTAYDKHWGRTPTVWGPGTTISLHDPNGAEVLSITVS